MSSPKNRIKSPDKPTYKMDRISSDYNQLSQPLFSKQTQDDSLMMDTIMTTATAYDSPTGSDDDSHSQKFAWLKKTRFRRAVIRLTSISLSRCLLYFPYIIYLCGLGNFLLWLVIISTLSLAKTSSLMNASKAEGS